jgi:hypothetical protein
VGEYRSDAERTRHELQTLVLPWLQREIAGPSDLVFANEGIPCQSCNQFDHQCGVDYWHRIYNGGIRGIATRIQWRRAANGRWPWDTFTIRHTRDSGTRTEWAKLTEAFDHPGWVRPVLHVQAYSTDGALDSAAAVHTTQLIQCMTDRGRHLPENLRRTDNAWFAWMSWDDLEAAGVRLKRYTGRAAAA